MAEREPDFSGWATKSDLKCSDGRTIKPGAFKHQDKMTVPLVWQHQHDNPENVLGHAILEDRAFGTYTYGFFNETERGQHAKQAVKHGDLASLSIYANRLTERPSKNGREVFHGNITEVSLVLAGANPGAYIENVNLLHGDEFTMLDEEAIIYTGLELEHQSMSEGDTNMATKDDQLEDNTLEHADGDKTVQEVFDGLSEEQKNVVYYMIGEALASTETTAKHSDEDEDGVDILAHIDNSIKEGLTEMTRNVFDQSNADKGEGKTLSHAQFATIIEEAQKNKAGFQETAMAHAAEYGFDDISVLFPDAKTISNSPELISRRMEWVKVVINGTKHSPFAKVKSITADITADEARAKGYIKGTQKKDEVVKLLRRTTSPATIYKKQKLDRDDLVDITDLDVVAWLKAEMRVMIEEEIARAILVGDGRSSLDEDKIKDPEGAVQGEGIRSILHDNELYAHPVTLAANTSPKDAVKGLVRARSHYRGSGKPTLFISDTFLTDIMLEEDKFGRSLYETEQSLADKLRVGAIVTVELFDDSDDLFAIMVNLADYTIGSNKGGELTSFEDFDIDFNQHKYLIETRLSGALTKPKSAIVVRRAQGTVATATAPSFADNTITIPNTTGVVYAINDEPVSAGDYEIDEDTEVVAVPAEGYYFANGTTTRWSYTYTA